MKLVSTLLLIFSCSTVYAKTVHYELEIARKPMNMSGKETVKFPLTVNGTIPAPTLEFTEGDEAEVLVRNSLTDSEVSIHWHGLLLPNLEDGVPYVSTPPIFSGGSRVFRFPIRQHGTYWYHSHTDLQEQKGVFGAIVIHPRKAPEARARDLVAVISDWSDEDGDQILRNLRKDGDYYLYKKSSVRSYFGALAAGGLKAQLTNEWQRMGGMDLSDVGYDAFLINGKKEFSFGQLKPGEKVRVRLVNAASSTYFYVSLSGLPFEVVAADGMEISPIQTKEVLLGMAETYDILFTAPDSHSSYELRATAQDGTGFTSGWLGEGTRMPAPDRPKPELYSVMDHSAHAGHSGHTGHEGHGTMEGHADHSGHSGHSGHTAPEVKSSITVDDLHSPVSTAFPAGAVVHDVKLVLDGDMSRYVWHINGKAIFEDRNIDVKEGEVVRFTFENQTMMHHPMHLHGHFFRVLNAFGARSPLKHTVDVSPHSTRTIEFLANEPGQWMLHCHNLYHMHSGMARVVRYLSFTPKPEVQGHHGHDPHLHDHVYWTGLLEAATNHGKGMLRALRTWDSLEARTETREDHSRHWDVEGDLFYRRWTSQFVSLVGGGSVFHEKVKATVGASILLPLLVEAQALVDHKGEFRGDLHRRFQWTSRIFSDAEFTFRQNEKTEFEVSLMWAPSWAWAIGAMLTEDRLGAGVQWRF